MNLQNIKKLPNYVRSFGVFHGLRLLYLIEQSLSKKSDVIKKYFVPGYSKPVHLRKTISDHSIFWQCIVQRQYDFSRFSQSNQLMNTYHEMVKQGITPLIIDCGGNIGLSSLYFANLFPEAKIYVVEPDEDNFKMIKRNTVSFSDRIIPLKGGVWNKSGWLKIINPESGSAAFRVDFVDENSGNAIRAYTIEDICTLACVHSPLIVKIDIEGAQISLFKEHIEWVSRSHLIMLELDDWLMPWKGTSRPFFRAMNQYPFDYLISGETIFCFRDFSEENT
ncbi:FkbM family methyltransferase [Chromatium okenii]|jgi:FkbM family methyltransferase|uniref:FkbM family methyltransferase n=1 Tax=Chromatium okenii TaxID=61644 RepID=UPI0026EF5271|nr:FkbM family methyltransferase [Chromatium okenii]MBV5309188.1 FkbM family methyltransferase [Chromatium okenii]